MKLLHVTEPLEDRMEQAFFSPPLSKQRVEYAVRHIRESDATSLVNALKTSLCNFSFLKGHAILPSFHSLLAG